MEPWIPLLGAACCCLPVAGGLVGVAAWFLVRGQLGSGAGSEASGYEPAIDDPTVRVTPPMGELPPTTEVPRAPHGWPREPSMPAAPMASPGSAPAGPGEAAPPALLDDEGFDFDDDEDDLATVVAPPPPGLLNPSLRPSQGASRPRSPASAPPAPHRSSAIHPRRPGQTIIAFDDDDEDDEDNEIG